MPALVAPGQHALEEGFVVRQKTKIAAATQQQGLLERALQSAIPCFDVPMFLGSADVDQLRLHAKVRHQLFVAFRVAPFRPSLFPGRRVQLVSCGAGVIGAVVLEHSTQLEQRALQTQAQRRQRLRLGDTAPLPV